MAAFDQPIPQPLEQAASGDRFDDARLPKPEMTVADIRRQIEQNEQAMKAIYDSFGQKLGSGSVFAAVLDMPKHWNSESHPLHFGLKSAQA